MTTLLVAKQYIKSFMSKYEVYLQPLGKLVLALVTLLLINSEIGYMDKINNISIVLVAALMCSFMPANFTVLIAAAFSLLHLYAVSMEYAIVALAIYVLMFLLYFRFSPKDTLVVLLTPLCFMLKIPYVIPIAMGLVGTPASVISVACGVVAYYMISFASEQAKVIAAMDSDDIVARFRYVIDAFVNNQAIMVTVAAFALTVIVVYLIRRMSIDHAWKIAITAGTLVNIMILLLGDLMFDTNVSIVGVILGSLVSVIIAVILEFFVFHLDYSRTETVQFEDDEYYYYVKAVPKITVAAPSKTVKKINTPKRKPATGQGRR